MCKVLRIYCSYTVWVMIRQKAMNGHMEPNQNSRIPYGAQAHKGSIAGRLNSPDNDIFTIPLFQRAQSWLPTEAPLKWSMYNSSVDGITSLKFLILTIFNTHSAITHVTWTGGGAYGWRRESLFWTRLCLFSSFQSLWIKNKKIQKWCLKQNKNTPYTSKIV